MGKRKMKDVGEGLQAISLVPVETTGEQEPADSETLAILKMVKERPSGINPEEENREAQKTREELNEIQQALKETMRDLDAFQSLGALARQKPKNIEKRDRAQQIISVCTHATDPNVRRQLTVAAILHQLTPFTDNGNPTQQNDIEQRIGQLEKEGHLVKEYGGELHLLGQRYALPAYDFPPEEVLEERTQIKDLFLLITEARRRALRESLKSEGHNILTLEEAINGIKGIFWLDIPAIPPQAHRAEVNKWSVAGPPGQIVCLSDGEFVFLREIKGEALTRQLMLALNNPQLGIPFNSWNQTEAPPQHEGRLSREIWTTWCAFFNALCRGFTMAKERKEFAAKKTVGPGYFLLSKPRPVGKTVIVFRNSPKDPEEMFRIPGESRPLWNVFFLASRQGEGDEQVIGIEEVPTHLQHVLGDYKGKMYPGPFSSWEDELPKALFVYAFKVVAEYEKRRQVVQVGSAAVQPTASETK